LLRLLPVLRRHDRRRNPALPDSRGRGPRRAGVELDLNRACLPPSTFTEKGPRRSPGPRLRRDRQRYPRTRSTRRPGVDSGEPRHWFGVRAQVSPSREVWLVLGAPNMVA
jgi:hypothetical protein